MDSNLTPKNVKFSSKTYNLTDSQKIDIIIERLCDGVQKEFMRRCNVSESTPTNWRKRNTMDYRKVSKGFPEISLNWLINSEGPMLLAELENPEPIVENVRAYTCEDVHQPLQVQETTSFDLAWFNATLRENADLKQRIETIQQRIIELERDNARLEERIKGAANWYYQAVSIHPDLK